MASNNKPGGATPLGKAVSSALIAACLVGIAYWYVTRPKADVQPVVVPTVSAVEVSAQKVGEPQPVEIPQVTQSVSKEVVAKPATQQQSTGSDDPYGSLSTKGNK